MRRIRVHKLTVYVATFDNDRGEHISLPLYRNAGGWANFGAYRVHGVSQSDPTYAAVHALPYKWRPKGRLLAALRKAR